MQVSYPLSHISRQVPRVSTELLDYYRWVSSQPLTVVDLETTGSNASCDRIIEIAVLTGDLTSGIQHQVTDLINPEVVIPYNIIRFTGITQPMVDYSAIESEVLPKYLPMLQSGILTAHNFNFDYRFLQAAYARLGINFVRLGTEQLCTVQLSRLLLPDLPSRRLPALIRHFGFNVGKSHRAEADTLACWLLAKELLNVIQNESNEELLTRFARQWVDLQQAAFILNCSELEAQMKLVSAGVRSRPVGRSGDLLYQRGQVEQVLCERVIFELQPISRSQSHRDRDQSDGDREEAP